MPIPDLIGLDTRAPQPGFAPVRHVWWPYGIKCFEWNPLHVTLLPSLELILPNIVLSFVVMNVVIAGECGAGKSSLINLISGRDVAQTSNDSAACTREVQSYKVSVGGYDLNIWDTPGLDEGLMARLTTRSSQILVKTLSQLKNNGGIHLIIFCMHGNRAKSALLKHYETIRTFTPVTVPVVAVITRLERYQDRMEDWWSNNAAELNSLGMDFVDHACITALPASDRLFTTFRERLVESRRVICDLIRHNCTSQLFSLKFPSSVSPTSPVCREKAIDDNGMKAGSQFGNAESVPRRVRPPARLRRIPTLFA